MSDEAAQVHIDLDALAERVAMRLAPLVAAQQTKLIGRRELAERLAVCERTIDRLVSRGYLPKGYQLGDMPRWDWSEVKKHLAHRPKRGRRTRGPTAQQSNAD